MPPYTLSRDDVACALWLRDEGEPGAVGCLSMLGSYLPGMTGRKVWVGHWAETLRFPSKLNSAFGLLIVPMPSEARKVLDACRYVVDGEFERAIRGDGQDPRVTARESGYELVPVYSSGESVVYEVRPNPPSQPAEP